MKFEGLPQFMVSGVPNIDSCANAGVCANIYHTTTRLETDHV